MMTTSMIGEAGYPLHPSSSIDDCWRDYDFLAAVVQRYQSSADRVKINVPEHRISCHRCGNIRKRRTLCPRPTCPHTFCGRCTEKLVSELGDDIFDDGCPVCKELCCCSNKSIRCERKHHCYRKCPATKSTVVTKTNRGENVHLNNSPSDDPPQTGAAISEDQTPMMKPKEESDTASAKDESNITGETGSTSCESVSESVLNLSNNCLPCSQPLKKKPRVSPASSSSSFSADVLPSPHYAAKSIVLIPTKPQEDCIMPNSFLRPHWQNPSSDFLPPAYRRSSKRPPQDVEPFVRYPSSYFPFDRNCADPTVFSTHFHGYPMYPPFYASPYLHNRSIPMPPIPIHHAQEDQFFYSNHCAPAAYVAAASYPVPRSTPPIMRHPVYYDQFRSSSTMAPTTKLSIPLQDDSVPSDSEGAMALLAMASSCNGTLEKPKSFVN